MEPQPPAKHRPWAFIAVLAASAFVFMFGLGRLGFLGPDEPRYAEVAREMFVSGDYITTRLCGCVWFEKPVLLYWMSAAGYELFGVNEFAARLPSVLAALATVMVVFGVLKHLALPRAGLASALVLATSGIFVAYARVATPDMILAATMTAALLSALLSTKATGAKRTVYCLISCVFIGLAMLAKGLVGIVLVVAIFGVYLVVTRQVRSVRWLDWGLGLVVCLAVAAIWYVPVTLRHGWQFIDEFFIRHHFERYTSNEFGHPQPFYFFPLVALAGVAPWMFFLIPAAARLKSLKPRDDVRSSLLVLAWIWVAVPILFFSFSNSKLPGYILPIFPALAVIVGCEIERLWRRERNRLLYTAAWLTVLVVIGSGVAFMVYVRQESVNVEGWRILLYALPLLAAVVSLIILAMGKTRAFTAGVLGVVCSLVFASVILLFPTLYDEVSLKSLSLEAASALRPGEKIGFYLKKEFAPVFYADGRVLCEPRRGTTFYALHQNMVMDALASEPSLILITNSKWVEGLKGDERFTTEFITARDDSVVLRVALKK